MQNVHCRKKNKSLDAKRAAWFNSRRGYQDLGLATYTRRSSTTERLSGSGGKRWKSTPSGPEQYYRAIQDGDIPGIPAEAYW